MYDSMTDVGRNFVTYIDKKIGTDIDVREAMGLFSMAIIGLDYFTVIALKLQYFGIIINYRCKTKHLQFPDFL